MKQISKFGGKPVEEGEVQEPELGRGLEIYAEAFLDLETERAYSDGFPLPIPYSKIRWYAVEVLELGYDEVIDFHEIIKSLDNWVLEEASKKRADLVKSKKTPTFSKFRNGKG